MICLWSKDEKEKVERVLNGLYTAALDAAKLGRDVDRRLIMVACEELGDLIGIEHDFHAHESVADQPTLNQTFEANLETLDLSE